MKITIHGTGYVGLVTGACIAQAGNQVLCVDIDAAKVAALGRGEIPIYEPGLAEVVKRSHAAAGSPLEIWPTAGLSIAAKADGRSFWTEGAS